MKKNILFQIPRIVFLIVSIVYAKDHFFGDNGDGARFNVGVVSSRMGLTFTDTETPDIRIKINNAFMPVTVTYNVVEMGGGLTMGGTMQFGAGTSEQPSGLVFPNRGLYHLTLSALSGGESDHVGANIAVVFTPLPTDSLSPWGIMLIPHPITCGWVKDMTPADIALSHKLLGASWSRVTFWNECYGTVTVNPPEVTADYMNGLWKEFATTLKDQGIHIMGEIAQCPRVLSSKPDDTTQVGDAGPMYARVKPADYALWDTLMVRTAREFSNEISYWEIWNEADIPDLYWAGTRPEFSELVRHTSKALRSGNPSTRILAGGFTMENDFVDSMLAWGMGQDIDLLSIHYTSEKPKKIEFYKQVLVKYNVDIPIWNTEEKLEVPLVNLSNGIGRTFHFCHIDIQYPGFHPLANRDLTLLPAGVFYSVAAHCIGTGAFVGKNSTAIPGHAVYFFKRGVEEIAVIYGSPGGPAINVYITVEPAESGKNVTLTNAWGKSTPLPLNNNHTHFPIPFSYNPNIWYINGAKSVSVDSVVQQTQVRYVFEAETGTFSAGWGRVAKSGFFSDTTVDIWENSDPISPGYWVKVPMNIPKTGKYEMFFCGNDLINLKSPRSLSPFVWRVDSGLVDTVNDAINSLQYVEWAPGETKLSPLSVMTLDSGMHDFYLQLTGRRDQPDTCYALWFDALALLPADNVANKKTEKISSSGPDCIIRPSQNGVLFLFTNVTPGDISIAVYSLQGRLIRKMGQNSNGSVYWKYRDAGGTSVPSGIYLATVKIGTKMITRRVMVVR